MHRSTAPSDLEPRRTTAHTPSSLIGAAVCATLVLAACHATVTPAPSPTEPPPTIEASPTPSPVGQTLVELKGKGNATSATFQASGEAVGVDFSYDCGADGASFTLNFYGANVSPVLPDVITDEFGTTRADSVSEPLNSQPGPFHFEVVTDCSWTVKVTGQP